MLNLKKLKTKGSTPVLNWFFTAFFADGSVIQQTQKNETGHSMMIDVSEKSSVLTHFELRKDGQAVTLDLVTGNFVVNGTPLQLHDQHFNPSKYKLTLVYWRETLAQRIVTGTVQEDGSIEREDVDSTHYVGRNFLGWQADDKKNTRVVLAVG